MEKSERQKLSDESYLEKIISSNLEKLMEKKGLHQSDLVDVTGYSAPAVNGYCKGKKIPSLLFLQRLKEEYGISIDDFLTEDFSPFGTASPDKKNTDTLKKYCGVYLAYYFDTSQTKGNVEAGLSGESVRYGIIFIGEALSSGVSSLKCAAVFGFHEKYKAERNWEIVRQKDSFNKVINHYVQIEQSEDVSVYYGNVGFSEKHMFINMAHSGTDRMLMIFYRVDQNNKPEYIGGIGTVNSVSKGRKHMPVVQFIGVSRYKTDMSPEEIGYRLLLDYPTFRAETEAREMIELFKSLYMAPDSASEKLSDYHKETIVRSSLERYIEQSLQRNIFRYGEISEDDDSKWYGVLKKEERNRRKK